MRDCVVRAEPMSKRLSPSRATRSASRDRASARRQRPRRKSSDASVSSGRARRSRRPASRAASTIRSSSSVAASYRSSQKSTPAARNAPSKTSSSNTPPEDGAQPVVEERAGFGSASRKHERRRQRDPREREDAFRGTLRKGYRTLRRRERGLDLAAFERRLRRADQAPCRALGFVDHARRPRQQPLVQLERRGRKILERDCAGPAPTGAASRDFPGERVRLLV